MNKRDTFLLKVHVNFVLDWCLDYLNSPEVFEVILLYLFILRKGTVTVKGFKTTTT